MIDVEDGFNESNCGMRIYHNGFNEINRGMSSLIDKTTIESLKKNSYHDI